MLNYITAEFLRAKKSISIKLLIIAGILVPAIIVVEFLKGANLDQAYQNSFLGVCSVFTVAGAQIVGILVLIFTYKKNDIYKIMLTQGRSKLGIVIYDFLSSSLLVIAISLFMLSSCFVYDFIFSKIYSTEVFIGKDLFLNIYFWSLINQLFINSLIFACIYITSSTSTGTIVSIVILFSTIFIVYTPQYRKLVLDILDIFYPYKYLSYENLTGYFTVESIDIDYFVVFGKLLMDSFISIFLSYNAFKRRNL